jgi:long-chain acyl-CoA synthetase
VQSAAELRATDRHVLFLPLSHSFAKAIEVAAVQIGFCTAFAESIDKIADNCGEVKPTFVCAVPRIFEKVYAKVVNGAKSGGAIPWAIFQAALAVGLEVSRERQAGREPTGLLSIKYAVADKLVFSKLRLRFGGQLRCFVSGSAPLSKELAEFFHAAGMLILEGYGLTETNSMTSINRLDRFKFGTVGPVLHPDLQVRIAADGEILTKGVTNLRSYYKQEEATREAIDSDGWFHTGDIGEIDEDGYIKITDRKKDLIKTSGGKYVAPQMIEGQLKMDPIISQAVVIGDQRKYVTTLLALNLEVAKKVLADAGHPLSNSDEEILRSPAVEQRIQEKLNELNRKLGSWEQVKYFRVLPRELSEAEGELTPTLKVKRKVVSERYRNLIDSMYEEQAGDKGDRD